MTRLRKPRITTGPRAAKVACAAKSARALPSPPAQRRCRLAAQASPLSAQGRESGRPRSEYDIGPSSIVRAAAEGLLLTEALPSPAGLPAPGEASMTFSLEPVRPHTGVRRRASPEVTPVRPRQPGEWRRHAPESRRRRSGLLRRARERAGLLKASGAGVACRLSLQRARPALEPWLLALNLQSCLTQNAWEHNGGSLADPMVMSETGEVSSVAVTAAGGAALCAGPDAWPGVAELPSLSRSLAGASPAWRLQCGTLVFTLLLCSRR